jgi:glycosyltransferase involved in cell wall biosynthesis
MKIGIVTTWFERGAAYVSKQFQAVWDKDHEVFIYVRGGENIAKNDPNWEYEKLTYGKRYSYTRLDLINLKHFESWIKENKLDIVFFNEQHIWHPILLCNELGIITGSYIDYYTPETVELFGIFDFLICNTKRHYSVFEWHPQVFYIPWGTNVDTFNIDQQKKTNLKEIVFFHSAGMNPYRKGTDYLIRAFNKLNLQNSRLIIHTQTEILNFFPDIEEIITKLKKKQKIEIIDETVSAPGLYHKGDVYVYPTRLEGIGLSIVEANACGMPVITTNEAPMNEFIKNGVNGHLINVSSKRKREDGYYWEESYIDIIHLQSILEDYAINIQNLEDRKRRALNFSMNNLDWNKNSKELLPIIKKVCILKEKGEVIDKVKEYENNRGIKFYIANIVFYQKAKQQVKRFFN